MELSSLQKYSGHVLLFNTHSVIEYLNIWNVICYKNFTFLGIDLLFFKVMKLLAVLLAYFINLLKPIHLTNCSFEE